MVVSLISLRYGRNYVVNAIEDVTRQQAAGEAWDLVLDRLYQMMWAALILALIVGIVAWLMGPSARATHTRALASGTIQRWRQPAEDHPNVFTNFIADWKPTIEVVAVALGLVFILFGPPPTGFSVLLTAVIVLFVIVATEVVAAPEAVERFQADNVDVVETVEIAGD
jgi:phosphatidylglycerophosphate synthase